MITFLVIAAVLTIIALAFVIPPLWRNNIPNDDIDRSSLNVSIYKERLAELEQEDLSPEQLEQAKKELEKTLAQDLTVEDNVSVQSHGRWASAFVILFVPMLAGLTYAFIGAPQALEPQQQAEAHGEMPADFAAMVEKLVEKLEENPNDAEGWEVLARSYVTMEKYDKAIRAYNQLIALVGDDDPRILTDFAKTIATSHEGQLTGQPSLLLKMALQANPDYEEALWLSGFAAAQQQDFKAAIQHWTHLRGLLPAEEEKAKEALDQQIAEARSMLLGNNDTEATNATSNTETTTNETETTIKTTNSITIEVSLDPALQDKVKQGDTLFIYARPTQGSPMPLAIVNQAASNLPVKVTLDDNMAMMPAAKLSNHKEVTILARVSSSGGATLQSGDLQGIVTPVSVGIEDVVQVVINEIVP